MVISYDHKNRNARLSLRQNEILEELANDEKLQKAGGAVPGLQHTVWNDAHKAIINILVPRKIFLLSTLNMEDTCSKPLQVNHTATTWLISSK